MKLFSRKPATPEREPLEEEVKAWYRELVEVENPMAVYFPPGAMPSERKARFFVLQCQHCMGVHTGACPRVKALKLFESGAIREVQFHDPWDDSAVIRFEDVFGEDDE